MPTIRKIQLSKPVGDILKDIQDSSNNEIEISYELQYSGDQLSWHLYGRWKEHDYIKALETKEMLEKTKTVNYRLVKKVITTETYVL